MKKLKITSIDDLRKMWKEDFLGVKGFFCPGTQNLNIREEVEIVLEINNEMKGKAKTKVVWQNFYGDANEFTPRGTFLKLISADDYLKKALI